MNLDRDRYGGVLPIHEDANDQMMIVIGLNCWFWLISESAVQRYQGVVFYRRVPLA